MDNTDNTENTKNHNFPYFPIFDWGDDHGCTKGTPGSSNSAFRAPLKTVLIKTSQKVRGNIIS